MLAWPTNHHALSPFLFLIFAGIGVTVIKTYPGLFQKGQHLKTYDSSVDKHALLGLDLGSQRQAAQSIANRQGLAVAIPQDIEINADVAHLLPEEVERRLRTVPLYNKGNKLVVATPDPTNQDMIDEVMARTGRELTFAVSTKADLDAMLDSLYRDDNLRQSTNGLIMAMPEESASRVLTRSQRRGIIAGGLLALLLLWRLPDATAIAMMGVCTLLYNIFSLYQCYIVYRAPSHNLDVSGDELLGLDENTLPVYTILVPLYHDAEVLPILLRGLTQLDYPANKLDIKLLLEEDDVETLATVALMHLPSYVDPVIVPMAQPRSKPKACNYGLIRARGEYVVIYDTEDIPEPDQLKKAVLAFRKMPSDVVCFQAKLDYYNGNQNLLTRWSAIEYTRWFELFLPSLNARKVPIPLSGSSYHFLTERLREIGAWDPYNVMEGADLGVRLFRHGWKAMVFNSTTYEEANSNIFNWTRQCSRWVKGYVQTFLVHMRHPLRLWRTLGPKAFFSFTMVLGGTVFSYLLNPILLCLIVLWYLTHAGFHRTLYPEVVFYMSGISLFIGNFAFVCLNIAACMRRKQYRNVKYAIISSLYWMLISVAAWKGILQLWTNPFYREKTVHGLYQKTSPGFKDQWGDDGSVDASQRGESIA